jgi:hypothetical protein
VRCKEGYGSSPQQQDGELPAFELIAASAGSAVPKVSGKLTMTEAIESNELISLFFLRGLALA